MSPPPKPDPAPNLDSLVPPTRSDLDRAHATDPSLPSQGGSGFLAPGQRPLPEYELIGLVGRGGFGEVWKARGPGGFEVALKFVRLGQPAGDMELRSLEVMKRVRHPNLLPVFGAWQRDDFLIIAMELADGTLLGRFRQARAEGHPGIPRDELLEYLREAARGLDFLSDYRAPAGAGPETAGIQHKDVKPHNLLLVGGAVKVADFGLARLMEHSVTTASGGLTPAYAAPEFFKGRMTLWSDQYSLAVAYCQLRGGRLPFEGDAMQIMAGHVTSPPDLTMLPEDERAPVARALAKDPAQRWPNCRAFAEAVATAGLSRPAAAPGHEQTQKTTKADSRTQAAPRSSGRRWLARALAGVAAVLAAAAVLALVRPGAHKVSPDTAAALLPDQKGQGGTGRAGTDSLLSEAARPPAPIPTALRLLQPEKMSAMPGATVAVPVSLQRENCSGPVHLEAEGLPPGVTASPVEVPDGRDNGSIQITADPGTRESASRVRLRARLGALEATREVVLTVRQSEISPPLPPESVPRPAAADRGPRPSPLDCTGPDGVSAAEVRRAQEAWAKYLGRQVEETVEIADGVRMTFVLIPPGKFRMGSPTGEEGHNNDESLHEVLLTEPFDLGKTEVTQAEYQTLTGNNPSHFQGADLPVETASWEEARDFAVKLTKKQRDNRLYRLPTEAEWEYACRGGRPPSQPFGVGEGRAISSREVNFNGQFPYGGADKGPSLEATCRVGSYPANALGLCDMHGNVWEWCADSYGPYPPGDVANPTGPAGGAPRVRRGGSWFSGARSCRAAARSWREMGNRISDLGFRLARSVPSDAP